MLYNRLLPLSTSLGDGECTRASVSVPIGTASTVHSTTSINLYSIARVAMMTPRTWMMMISSLRPLPAVAANLKAARSCSEGRVLGQVPANKNDHKFRNIDFLPIPVAPDNISFKNNLKFTSALSSLP